MKHLELPVLAVVAVVIAGCQAAKQQTHKGGASIFRPELWLKDDGLYYAASDEPYTGKHEAWYANGDKAWEGEMVDGKRHGQYTQWYPENGGRHVAGHYLGGNRHGEWGQWYPGGQAEITSDYLDGIESKITFYSERGDMVSEKVYWKKVRQRLNRQAWRNFNVVHWRNTPSYYHPSYYYQGSSGWTPPGGGTASDFRNLGGGASSSSVGGGSSGGGASSGGASVSAPEGGSVGSPNTP